MSRSKYVVPLIVLVVSASLEGLAYLQLQMRYVELQNNYDGIKVLYSTLNSSYHLLNMNYERLSREYFEAQSNLESVTQSLVVLQSQHADLLEDYGSLEKKYEELRRSYLSLETTHKIDEVMRIGNSLESYYDVVRAEKGPKRWWTEQMRVNFCADLAMHDLGRNVWPTLESNYVEIAGEHSYETAKRKIDAIIAEASSDYRSRPDFILHHIRNAIQKYAESNRYSVVREFCGHGIGKNFHEDPHVMHFGKAGEGDALEAGMIFTIEPMLNIGKRQMKVLKDGWTAVTKDGSLSAHFEHSIVVRNGQAEILSLLRSPKRMRNWPA